MNTQTSKPNIVLLHFAGGNCYSLQFLKRYMPHHELVMLELPGRGKRTAEDLLHDKSKAVADLFDQLMKLKLEGDFIIYGHSMGATLGLLLCEQLEQAGHSPACLIVTGSAGPGVGEQEQRYKLKGEDFKNALRRLGGISEEVLGHEELFEYFEPVIRADFELLEKDELEPAGPLRVPIHAIMGSEEEDSDQISNWQRFTMGALTTEIWKGNHFFINEHAMELAGVIKDHYRQVLLSKQNQTL